MIRHTAAHPAHRDGRCPVRGQAAREDLLPSGRAPVTTISM